MSDRTADWFTQQLGDAKFRLVFEEERLPTLFAEQLIAAMDAKGISRAELARRLGKSKAWVTRALRGDHNVTCKTMVDLAFHCGLRVDVGLDDLDSDRRWSCPAAASS